MFSVDIQKRRGAFSLETRFDVPAGQGVLGVVGASGSGKTTLLESIAGIVAPDGGRIALGDTVYFDGSTNLPIERRKIGYVFQDDLLFDHMTVRKNLLYGASDDSALSGVADALGIAGHLDKMPRQLSGGERRRVALGRALLREPELMLLDEPLTGLDSSTAQSVLLYLKRLLADLARPAIYVSHSLSEINFICDRALGLANGRIVHDGAPLAAVTASGCVTDAALSELRSVFAVSKTEQSGLSGGLRLMIAPGVEIAALDGGERERIPAEVGARKDSRTSESGSARRDACDGESVDSRQKPRASESVRGCAVYARDVVLASEAPRGVSARNIFRGPITRIERGHSLAVVEIDIGAPLLAEVGFESLTEMNLNVGDSVYSMFKASAVRFVS